MSNSSNSTSEQSTPTPAQDVLVIGGGMAGLAGALALRENGASVTLVENAPAFGEVGAGLQMAPNASRVLKRWGLLDKALDIGVQPKHLVFRDAVTGEELTRQSLGAEFEERYGAPYVVIHRSDLHRILLEACQENGVTLLNGVFVEKVETEGEKARAYAANGDIYEADAVLAADGLKSTLRKAVAEDAPVPSSYVAYRGTVPITDATPKADLEDVIVYLGPNCHLVQYPLRKGELLNTVAVFKSASFERGEEQYGGVDELEEAYKDCVPAVQDALKNLATGIRWPMYDKNPIENWVSGRMTLIGDAAHPMLQYLAQGACQALEDAAVLQEVTQGTVFTEAGIDASAWEGAFRDFNEARAGRTARIQRTARVWGESWHVSGLARTLRNLLFKSRGDGNFQYNDWLYGQSGEGVPSVEAKSTKALAN
ncbi:3-hydroxybenzoate 6-hydroxylase [Arthrobacter psychrolactophilus]|uniref:3-hydroxybenzoate 6-hydroxylase n=1 Tax=Arthrobacter psychrolactophilus TaxID=92442 RepID=A0A2V5J7E5_9MICC|nr:FAD-dependent oxidoreductase [Arthrobacter psychrolactophilus]PYI38730.1 3-hydroxybenzoate 6-hydroxylase [Arthrobacter psychrolactophilus]